ncbi:MAG: nucleoside triphosphate pyrophosphohydrolase [bacterium]
MASKEKGVNESSLDLLVQVMATLRGNEGCPWDKEQTHRSLRRYLIEECYEVIEAIDNDNMNNLREELGDLLLQVVFHARLAEEARSFDLNDVIQEVVAKMVRRHPHVFGQTKAKDSDEVLVNWEAIKKEEKKKKGQGQGVLEGVPKHLPALLRAYKIQGRAAQVGFDWPSIDGAWEKVYEEAAELKTAAEHADYHAMEEELGDLLFAVVNIARFLGIEPELALAGTTAKFEQRFHYIEQQASSNGQKLEDLSLQEMDSLWDQAKNKEKQLNFSG